MVPKVEVLEHVDHVVAAVFVLFPQVVEDSHLHQSLVMEPFLVPDYFYGHVFVGHVIQSPDDLAEAALPDHLQDFVSVADVVVENLQQVGLMIVCVEENVIWFNCAFPVRYKSFIETDPVLPLP